MAIYNKKITDFGTYLEVTKFSKDQIRMVGEATHKGGRSNHSIISDEEQEKRTKAQYYAIKRKIRHYILANDFEYFVTFTLNPDKVDSLNYQTAKETLLKWCEIMRKVHGKFDYLFVPEFHRSGRVHFHGVLGNTNFEFVEALNVKTEKPIKRNGRKVYNLPAWKFGFTDCEKIESKEKTSSYMTKYITKELMTGKEMFGKKRYFPSKGLKKPDITFVNDDRPIDFKPNLGLVSVDSVGNKSLERAVYKINVDPETGEMTQQNTDSLLKLKEIQKR